MNGCKIDNLMSVKVNAQFEYSMIYVSECCASTVEYEWIVSIHLSNAILGVNRTDFIEWTQQKYYTCK